MIISQQDIQMQMQYDDCSSPPKMNMSPARRRSPRQGTPHPGSGAIADPQGRHVRCVGGKYKYWYTGSLYYI